MLKHLSMSVCSSPIACHRYLLQVSCMSLLCRAQPFCMSVCPSSNACKGSLLLAAVQAVIDALCDAMSGMEERPGTLPIQCSPRWCLGGGCRDSDSLQRWRIHRGPNHELNKIRQARSWAWLLSPCNYLLATGPREELHLFVSPPFSSTFSR